MESTEAKVSIYTFKMPVRAVKDNKLTIDIGNGIVVDVNCDVADIEHLVRDDLITIKLEIPCPPSKNTNPQSS